jgi:glutamyl-tRNA reductase
MNLVLIGLNHKTAAIEIRERIAFTEAQVPEGLASLRDDYGLMEALIVSTCNRVEVISSIVDTRSSFLRIKAFLEEFHSLKEPIAEQFFYSFRGDALVEHVFRVTSSLDSMVPGESQILGQMKKAFAESQKAGLQGENLGRLMPYAFFVAKRVRNETAIAQSVVSVSSMAVELALKIFGGLTDKTVLILGAGKMSELATRSLIQAGATGVQVVNRTFSKAEELARKFDGRAMPFEELDSALVSSDIVIASTSATSYILNKKRMDQVIRARRYSPLFLIDISVPRNVDPAVNELEEIFLFDIDDLESVLKANRKGRSHEATLAEEIIRKEVVNYSQIQATTDVGPIVSSLRSRIEEICLEEVNNHGKGLDVLPRDQLERILRRTAHRIAHPLMLQVKKDCTDPKRQVHNLEMLKEAFKLDETE